jgi:uncharacterized protein (DUF4415 family)
MIRNYDAMATEPDFDMNNPEWTAADFARARPAHELLGDTLAANLVRPRGRPKASLSSRKQAINIRLDDTVIAHFKADGPGWQTRLNAFLVNQLRLSAD